MPNNVPNYIFRDIQFIGSFPKVAFAPQLDLPEYAFIGRSNVGKSSLINFLCDRKNLAKTSSTPGKTQLINLFKINDEWILADLPGYGYAKTSKVNREKWGKMIESYLLERLNLATIFILIDSRHTPQSSDLDRIEWLAEKGLPFSIVFTKIDKVKPQELRSNVNAFMAKLKEFLEFVPNHFITSSEKRDGGDDLLAYIQYVSSQMS
jgi:GTP-binding protein